MGAVVALAAVELRRFTRDRSNIFFVFILPLLLVLLIGQQFGDQSDERSSVVMAADPSALRDRLVASMDAAQVDVTFAGERDAKGDVARGRADAALVVDGPAAAAFEADLPLEVKVVAGSGPGSLLASQRIQAATRSLATEEAKVSVLIGEGLDRAVAEGLLADVRADSGAVSLEIVDLDEVAKEFEGAGQFDFGASGQLLLFVFLSSLAGSVTLIQSRSLGVVGRVLAAPVTTATVIAGQALGRFAIAFVQGAYIMAGSSLLFGVQWGTLWLALAVMVMFCAVAASAAMVIGSVIDNENAASGIGIGAGLVLAGIGGSMMPLELFPDTLRTVANFTPHAWAYEAFADLQRRDGTFADIAPSLGVLAVMATVLLALGSFLLRRSMARAM